MTRRQFIRLLEITQEIAEGVANGIGWGLVGLALAEPEPLRLRRVDNVIYLPARNAR